MIDIKQIAFDAELGALVRQMGTDTKLVRVIAGWRSEVRTDTDVKWQSDLFQSPDEALQSIIRRDDAT
jgi:hypothetical protein